MDFYPRSPCGERRALAVLPPSNGYFYPRSPCGERQLPPDPLALAILFLSTLSLRRATIMIITICIALKFLSTLSLRRATQEQTATCICSCYFYPRSPCGERLVASRYTRGIDRFLSTLSLRRATHCQLPQMLSSVFLSTLSLRRATQAICSVIDFPLEFLSTLSLRRATRNVIDPDRDNGHFYPRSPCGERRGMLTYFASARNFYPRSPCGERPVIASLTVLQSSISIHALLAESDLRDLCDDMYLVISIHALLAESDPTTPPAKRKTAVFLSTLSLRRATQHAALSGG